MTERFINRDSPIHNLTRQSTCHLHGNRNLSERGYAEGWNTDRLQFHYQLDFIGRRMPNSLR
jgi:hypothetical protein